MEIRAATTADIASIRELLASYSLPVSDIDPTRIEFFVATDEASIAGVVGVEISAAAGLLRSLAVRAGRRGSNIGDQLVGAAQSFARKNGAAQLFLLTETARDYFSRRGFSEISRASAPASIQASTEFRSLCPASATCMSKTL